MDRRTSKSQSASGGRYKHQMKRFGYCFLVIGYSFGEVAMRTLSSTLLAAQKKASRTPYVKVEVSNEMAGVVRLDWARLYSGTEPDGPHAVALAGDGALIRVRLGPGGGETLYRQHVTNPGPASDFSPWADTGQYGAVAVAIATSSAEVSICWVR